MSQRIELGHGQVQADKKPELSGSMVKFLIAVRDHGRKAHPEVFDLMTYAVLGGLAEQRGLVRTVKHRDHTRSYALTEAGRQALKEIEP